MKVRATCNLKNSSMKDKFPGGMISEGTIFEGDKASIPDFIFGELERKSGAFELLPELKSKKKEEPKKEEPKKEEPKKEEPKKEEPKKEEPKKKNQKKKSSLLREKLTKTGN